MTDCWPKKRNKGVVQLRGSIQSGIVKVLLNFLGDGGGGGINIYLVSATF